MWIGKLRIGFINPMPWEEWSFSVAWGRRDLDTQKTPDLRQKTWQPPVSKNVRPVRTITDLNK